MLIMPMGMPAASKHSAIRLATSGVYSLDLNTTVFPASSAGTICPLGKCPGKLNGPSTAVTPCGLYRVAVVCAPLVVTTALRRPFIAAIESGILLIIASTSPSDSQSGLPVSRLIITGKESPAVPWHRVINSRGQLSTHKNPDIPDGLQRALLEREGIKFDAEERMDLSKHLWLEGLSGS